MLPIAWSPGLERNAGQLPPKAASFASSTHRPVAASIPPKSPAYFADALISLEVRSDDTTALRFAHSASPVHVVAFGREDSGAVHGVARCNIKAGLG